MKGKKVGVVANQTSMLEDIADEEYQTVPQLTLHMEFHFRHLIKVYSKKVFAPEHGFVAPQMLVNIKDGVILKLAFPNFALRKQ